MKPTFLVIGAAKAGTTSLCGLLGNHPDIFMSDPKETNFFAYDELFARGPQWYESLYSDAGNCSARGEGSPLYTIDSVYPDAAKRIADYDGTLKLVFIVRHPLRRIESGWLEMRSWGDEIVHADFERALELNRDWLIDSTKYWRQLERYRSLFPDEQILVLFFEDFVAEQQRELSRCFSFLGVDANARIDSSESHANPTSGKRVRRRSISKMRSLPGIGLAYNTVRDLTPEAVRRLVRNRILNVPVTGRPSWKPEAQRAVANELRDDCNRLLDYCDKRLDFWDLDTPLS